MKLVYAKSFRMSARLTLIICTLWSGLAAARETIELDAGLGQVPESVAVDRRGAVFASLSPRQSVVRISPDGSETTEYFLPLGVLPDGALGPLGVALDHRGNVYVAVQGCMPPGGCDNAANGIWRISTTTGHINRLHGTGIIEFPNDLTFDRRGNLFVTDTTRGAVWKLRRIGWGHRHRFLRPQIWKEDPALTGTGALGQPFRLGANGIAFSNAAGARGEILVANTERATIFAIPIERHGSAGELDVVAGGECPFPPLFICDPSLLAVDGIDVDRFGDVFGVTVVDVSTGSPLPVSTLYHVKRRTGQVQRVVAGEPVYFATDVTVGRSFDDAKTVWLANQGALAALFGLPVESSIVRLDLENAWFEAEPE